MAVKENSIRQIVRRGLEAGLSTPEIGAQIRAQHPTSKGAVKSAAHINWYKSKMKAVWSIPTAAAAAAPVVEPVEVGAAAVVEPVEVVAAAAPTNKKGRRAAAKKEKAQAAVAA